MTLQVLSQSSSVSRSMLSEIERGRVNPTLAVTWRIAQAFGISIDELLETAPRRTIFDVIRADNPAAIFASNEFYTVRTLSPLHLEKDIEIYEIRVEPGAALRSAPHYRNTEEFLTVVSGKAVVRAGEEAVDLATGDSAHYPVDVPHALENPGDVPATLYLVVKYRPE